MAGPFGVHGQVKVVPLTEFAERFAVGTRVRVGDLQTVIEGVAVHSGRLILKLEGLDTPEAVRELSGETVFGLVPERPELEPGEFLVSDLVGLNAVTPEGRSLGSVDEVLPFPAHDVLRIGELLVPAVKEFVVSVNLEAGTITIRLLEGMETEGS
ncbi:MAG: ribosome maturation factor RimM [Fimbriimonadales bacterium]